MKTIALLLGATALLAACSDPLPVASNATAVAVNGTEDVMPSEGDVEDANGADVPATAPSTAVADYTGRWIGVEGMYLTIAAKPTGGVTLDMQWDLDNRGTFDGTVTPAGIAFRRGGRTEVLKPTDGAATGLKYLAGKTDCLTVTSGEGYCRD